jgi:hypothetical protein
VRVYPIHGGSETSLLDTIRPKQPKHVLHRIACAYIQAMPARLKIQAQDLCPHGAQAIPFLTYHICLKDRIGKEVNRLLVGRPELQHAMPVETAGGANASGSSSAALPQLPRQIPGPGIGARHSKGSSSQLLSALGPSSWAASGGIKSTYQQASGIKLEDRESSPRADLVATIGALDSAAEARGLAQQSAAAVQREAMRQRSENSLLRHGPSAIPPQEAEQQHAMNLGAKRSQSDSELRSAAAANQLNAVRQRGERTLIRVGKMTAGQVEAAKREGHGTLVTLAEAGARGRAAQFGRATMIAHPPA